MIPKRILLENFLSFGEPATEIVFDDCEPLWVLGGPNGVGKSAIFDAITYCLYSEHRGGKQDHASLIRHGANSLRLVFEFEYDGIDYRITRNRPRKGKTTQKVEQRDRGSGEWTAVANLNSVEEVDEWSERTLGLNCKAFCCSVLLLQGKADQVILSKGSERLEILKAVIGVDRYESLSDLVHQEFKTKKGALESARKRREGNSPVEMEALAAAQASVDKAELACVSASENERVAMRRVAEAKQWADLDQERTKLQSQLRDADDRAAEAETIRAGYQRVTELKQVVPLLQKCIDIRAELAELDRKLLGQAHKITELKNERERLLLEAQAEREKAVTLKAAAEEQNRKAEALKQEIERDTKLLQTADTVQLLRKETEGAIGLQDELATAQERWAAAAQKHAALDKVTAIASDLLKRAKARQKEFASVKGGVTCSLCGQVVTAEHASAEQAKIKTEIVSLEKQLRASERDMKRAAKEMIDADLERDRLSAAVKEQTLLLARLVSQEQILEQFGIASDPADLRRSLQQKTLAEKEHRSASKVESKKSEQATKLAEHRDADRRLHEKELITVEAEIRKDEQRQAMSIGRQSPLHDQLTDGWRERLPSLASQDIKKLEAEWGRLESSRIADRFDRLKEDGVRRDGWSRRLAEVEVGIGAIPEESRITPIAANSAVAAARSASADAEKTRRGAHNRADALTRQAQEYRDLVEEVAAAEHSHDLHKRLDDLLGKSGIQRELVRAAERAIVSFANETVYKLSDGDLSIELDDSVSGGDEAFALVVRRADDPVPIAVNFLSGSQKFRVAVSVALAIGQYAAGQTHRLESVIIDEGFGSLDREGLRAAAEELNRLRGFLKRIILVSHQEEFASRFPVVIQLSHTPNGTTAKAVRQG